MPYRWYVKGGDVVIVEGKGSKGGNPVTAYGPSGKLGASGVKATGGGDASDRGKPVSKHEIENGTPASPGDGGIPPAPQIWP